MKMMQPKPATAAVSWSGSGNNGTQKPAFAVRLKRV